MGRIRPQWYYRRQADEAQRRENYYENRTPPAEDQAIESRGASTDLFYRSLILLEGTDHLIYKVSVPNSTLALLPAADAGLLTTLTTGQVALSLRGSGIKPTKIHWFKGTSNPVRRRTAWGTTSSRYYDTTGGKSHYSIPFSKATGNFSADDLKDAFETMFKSGGTRRGLLGPANGRAHITWEVARVSAQS